MFPSTPGPLLGYTRDPGDPLAPIRAQFPSLFYDDDHAASSSNHHPADPCLHAPSDASTATLSDDDDDDIFSAPPHGRRAASTIPTSAHTGYYVDQPKRVVPARRSRASSANGTCGSRSEAEEEKERTAVLREVGSWVPDVAATAVTAVTGANGVGKKRRRRRRRRRPVVLHQAGEGEGDAEARANVAGGPGRQALVLPLQQHRHRRRCTPDLEAVACPVGELAVSVAALPAAAPPQSSCARVRGKACVLVSVFAAGLLLYRAVAQAVLVFLTQYALLASSVVSVLWLTARVMLAFRFTRLETALTMVVEALVGAMVVDGRMG